MPLLRGLSTMSIGILSAWVYIETKSFSQLRGVFINIASISTIALMFIAAFVSPSLDVFIILLSLLLLR